MLVADSVDSVLCRCVTCKEGLLDRRLLMKTFQCRLCHSLYVCMDTSQIVERLICSLSSVKQIYDYILIFDDEVRLTLLPWILISGLNMAAPHVETLFLAWHSYTHQGDLLFEPLCANCRNRRIDV